MYKALVFFSEGFEEIEAVSPVDYLRRAGLEVTIVSVNLDSPYVTGAHGIKVYADITLSDYLNKNESLPDVVVIPGGMPGATNLASCKELLELINKMNDENKTIAALCASPAVVLAKTNALKEKAWTCYPNMENFDEFSKAYISGHKKNERVVTDKNVITAFGPGAAEEFSMAIVEKICGKDTKEKVKEASMQR